MYLYFIIGILFIMLILFVMLFRVQRHDNFFSAELSKVDLSQSIKDLAQDMRKIDKVGSVPKIKKYLRKIRKAHDLIEQKICKNIQIYDYEKWLYENYNWIKLNIKQNDFQYFSTLPHIKNQPRILTLARLICASTKFNISAETISDCIKQFNKVTPLQVGEIMALKDSISIAIMQQVSVVANWCITDCKMANAVDSGASPNDKLCDIESYVYRYKHSGKSINTNEFYRNSGLNLDGIDLIYNNKLVENSILCNNCITSLKKLGDILTMEFLLKLPNIYDMLSHDDIFKNMDVQSQLNYFFAIEKLSKLYGVGELAIAKSSLELAEKFGVHFGKIIFDHRYAIKLHLHSISTNALKKPTTQFDQKLFVATVWLVDLVLTAISVLFTPFLWLKIVVGVCVFFATFTPSNYLVSKLFSLILPQRAVHRMSYKALPSEAKTLVAVSNFITSMPQAKECYDKICVRRMSEIDKNITFCMLIDLKNSEEETSPADKEIFDYFNNLEDNDISILIRKRAKLASGFGGYERKRGAILQLNESLITSNFEAFCYTKNLPQQPKFVAVLDDDSRVQVGAISSSVCAMLHPQNEQYDLMTFDCRTSLSSVKNKFARLVGNNSGVDSYCNYSDFYYNLSGRSIFCGKGIYRLESFYNKLNGKIPSGKVLSHDIIEGAMLTTGALAIPCFEDSPNSFCSFVSRGNRWFRGDLLLLRFLFSKNITANIYRHIIFCNVLCGISCVFNAILIAIFFLTLNLKLLLPLGICLLLLPFIETTFTLFKYSNTKKYRYNLLTVAKLGYDTIINIFTMPFWTINNFWLVCKTIFFSIFKKEKLLTWKTFYQQQGATNIHNFAKLIFLPVLAMTIIGCVFFKNYLIVGYVVLFILALILQYVLQLLPLKKQVKLSDKDKIFLKDIANKTCNYFDDMLKESVLICDNIQINPANVGVKITSPTNIGFALISKICQFELENCTIEECKASLALQLEKISNLKKWNGHLYNWYELLSGEPTENKFISSVDSGNFVAMLYVALSFCKQNNWEWHTAQIKFLIEQTNFEKLFLQEKMLYAIGYNVDNNSFVGAYDMLASESRLLTYIACCKKGDMRAWQNLCRTHTNVKGNILVSWSGTAFEYLMPQIFMPDIENSLLTTTMQRFCRLMTSSKCCGLWGISESGYYNFDNNLNYQYHAFGLAKVSLKAQLNRCVISPYSTALALKYQPKKAMENFKKIDENGGIGRYGCYEAIDFTSGKQVVNSYMSHHQGMLLASIANLLCDNVIGKLFWQNKVLQSGSLCLEEQPSSHNTKALNSQEFVYNTSEKECVFCSQNLDFDCPSVFALTSGQMSYVTDNLGNNFTKHNNIFINRFKPEPYENFGGFVYINCDEQTYCPTFFPMRTTKFKYNFAKSSYDCTYENLTKACKMQVFLSNSTNCQTRKISFSNTSTIPKSFKVAYVEQITLSSWEDDNSHPAYNDMFVHMDFDKELSSLIAHRKQRALNGDMFCGLCINGLENIVPVCNIANFVGRCRDFGNPQIFEKSAFEQPNLNDVLYPCFGFIAEVTLNGGEQKDFSLTSVVADDCQSLRNMLSQINQRDFAQYAYESARLSTMSLTKKYLKDYDTFKYFESLASVILYQNYDLQQLQKMFKLQKPLPLGLEKSKKFVIYDFDGNDKVLQMLVCSCVYSNLVGVKFDLVIAYDEDDDYYQITKERLVKSTNISDLYSLPFIKFFVKTKSNIESFEIIKLFAICDAREKITAPKFGRCSSVKTNKPNHFENVAREIALQCGNGGFDKDNSYVVESIPMLAYSNVICGKNGGFVVTENGGGFVYNNNSYSNKLTLWDNQVVFDKPSEQIIISFNGNLSRINKLNRGGFVRHNIGSTDFVASINNVQISLNETIVENGICKVWKIELLNKNAIKLPIEILFKLLPCLSNTWNKSMIFDQKIGKNAIKIANALTGQEMYLCSNLDFNLLEDMSMIHDLTENETIGIGVGKSSFYNPSHAICQDIILDANKKKTIYFCLSSDYAIASKIDEQTIELALAYSQYSFNNMSPIKINSGQKNLDILINDWLFYQVESSRINGKCGYYQVGGAVGFRDQLQDCLAILYKNPDFVKAHILDCAEHQYIEGDVMHWWHKPRFGVRTRITDDRLFLVYLTYEYIKFSGDTSILSKKVPYLVGDKLLPLQEARLEYGQLGDVEQSLLGHLKKAIDCTLNYGKHGLLLIGGGDWNDALNEIGLKNKGESVWLSMFAVDVINKYCEFVDKDSSKEYKKIADDLKVAIEKANFDGYYARAYTDDGEWLGTKNCKFMSIDLLCQSFATLSNIGSISSQQKCLRIAGQHLVDAKNGIIKLLDPPFEKSKYYGYVSSYPSGVRENGGQYSHASIWYIKACAVAKQKNVANKLLKMINPINRCCNSELAKMYMGEPYVMPADIYTNKDNYGRMGWSWYTGSASWLYDTVIKDFFGVKIVNSELHFSKPILENWDKATLQYKYVGSKYNISFMIEKQDYIVINNIKHYGAMILPMSKNVGNVNVCVCFVDNEKASDDFI